MRRGWLLLIACIASAGAQTTTNVWIGTTNLNWSYALNWSRGVTPQSTDLVLFGAEFGGSTSNNALDSSFSVHTLLATNYPGTMTTKIGTLTCQNLHLKNWRWTSSDQGLQSPTVTVTATNLIDNSTFTWDGGGGNNTYAVLSLAAGSVSNSVFVFTGRYPEFRAATNTALANVRINMSDRSAGAGGYFASCIIPDGTTVTNVTLEVTAGCTLEHPAAAVNTLIASTWRPISSVNADTFSNTVSVSTRGYALTANRLHAAGGAFSASNSTLIINRELRLSPGATFNHQASTVQFNVSTNEITSNATNYFNLLLSRPGKLVTLTNAVITVHGRLLATGAVNLPITLRGRNGSAATVVLSNHSYCAGCDPCDITVTGCDFLWLDRQYTGSNVVGGVVLPVELP